MRFGNFLNLSKSSHKKGEGEEKNERSFNNIWPAIVIWLDHRNMTIRSSGAWDADVFL